MTDASTPEPISSDAPVQKAASIPGIPDNWPQLATIKIVDKVDTVRIKTSGPAINIARTAVYGIIVAVLTVIALILLVIGVTRGLNEALGERVWLAYFILGGVFSLIGMLLWRKRPHNAAG